jgi:hypothetical protein
MESLVTWRRVDVVIEALHLERVPIVVDVLAFGLCDGGDFIGREL